MKTSQSRMMPNASRSPFSLFEKHGDTLHFKIEDYRDLEQVLELDEALWIATTAPVSTLNADEEFLALLDVDQDGRLRAEEVKDGIRFLLSNLGEYSGIRTGNNRLHLQAINKEQEPGRRIHASATKVLKRLRLASDDITLEHVRTIKAEVLQGGLDEAGIVLPEATDDSQTGLVITSILGTVGGRNHPNGMVGVDRENMEKFFTQCRLYLDWLLEAGEIGAQEPTGILPLGGDTAQGYELFHSLSHKLTQYFLLCDIMRLNPNLLERALAEPEANVVLNLLRIEQAETYLADAPLSLLNVEGNFDLSGEINPYFRKTVTEFAALVAAPLLGTETSSINKQSLQRLYTIFHPYQEWIDRKPDVQVEQIPPELIQKYLDDPTYREMLERLIEESHQTAFVLENLRELERLLLYQAYILPLTNSFVSFPHLYNPEKRALFEEGTLIMDGRHFTLAIKVDDREHHIETCRNSNIFVIYCELYGDDGEMKYEIATPVTSGNRGAIHLHKWGIFNDIHGNELHAKVVDIVENPISFKEAVAEPFIRINRSFFSRLEQFSSKAEERFFRRKEKKDSEKKKKDDVPASLLAGGGVAVAAVGSSFAFMVKTLSALTMKALFLALLIVTAIIAIPAGISAYYKLSRRDLSTILEGSGWGLNSRMKLTAAQAKRFTFRPAVAPGNGDKEKLP